MVDLFSVERWFNVCIPVQWAWGRRLLCKANYVGEYKNCTKYQVCQSNKKTDSSLTGFLFKWTGSPIFGQRGRTLHKMLFVLIIVSCTSSMTMLSVSHLILGLYSLSGKTSYRKISWSLEAARFWFKLFQSLWNLAGTSATLLPRCLSNFRAIRPLQHPISRFRDFTRRLTA